MKYFNRKYYNLGPVLYMKNFYIVKLIDNIYKKYCLLLKRNESMKRQ